jgi:hypothetical protein
VTLRLHITVLAIFLSAFAYADRCRKSLVLLGIEFAGGSDNTPVSRGALLREMAALYAAGLQDTTMMQAFELRLQELAHREAGNVVDLYKEIEALDISPSELNELRAEREDRKRQELLQLYLSLEPYLDRIGHEHRGIIERELILPGFVKPLSIGEVEFLFRGEHRFVVGDDAFWGVEAFNTKEASFGIGDDFAIGQTQVTQLMYFLAALGGNEANPTPSLVKEGDGVVALNLGGNEFLLKPNHPVENVSYFDARDHARRVSVIVGGRYGLPNETQWEFATRAGNSGKFHFGDDDSLLPHYGWFSENSGGQMHTVGELRSNGFHLFDTHGNVWEWTAALRDDDFVIRGGGWRDVARGLRSARRLDRAPGYRDDFLGFRLVREGSSGTRPTHTFSFGEPKVETKAAVADPGSRR